VLDCPHRPPCPGCPRLGEPDIAPSARAALESLARERGLSGLSVVHGPRTAFRHRARLAVRGRARSPKIGIFEAGSHRVVDIPRCLVHHPLVNDVAREARAAIRETATPPYSDDAHAGLLRYLQVVVERRTETAQVVVVANDENPARSEPFLRALSSRLGPRLHSLFWNGNPARTNAILGPHSARVTGPEAVEEAMGGARVFYPPGAFGQSNLPLSSRLVDAVHALVPDRAQVLELYAGVGAIGLGLATRASELSMNELSDESLHGLCLGVAVLPDSARARVKVIPGPAGTALAQLESADVVIVDPPRKGLDPEVLGALAAASPQRLIYVACGLDSFLSDERALSEPGRLRLTALQAFDLFPHTDHVETLAVFDRI
jgi:tRNA/tmRNA/rRNA uracil-C5-methylase (TrmA/RlmC/RlmD family)